MATFRVLPREMRDKIYSFLLVSPNSIDLATDIASGRAGHLTIPIEIHNIGRVSSASKEEALEVYFRDNTFSLTPPGKCHENLPAKQLLRWRWHVGIGYCLRHIRSIEVELSYNRIIGEGRYQKEKSLYTIRMTNICSVTRTANGGTASYCVCELEEKLAKLMDGVRGYRGEALLDFAEPLLEDANAGKCFRGEQCEACAKVKLVPS